MTAPPINAKTFPYQRKWTREQIDELTARSMRLAETMTDAVGPTGQVMSIPADILQILALHLAIAGADVHDELAYITPVIVNVPTAPADFHQWVLKTEYEPAPPDPDEINRKAHAAAEQIKRQLSPEVRAAVAAMMRDEYEKAVNDDCGS